jgi:hypothetical protein
MPPTLANGKIGCIEIPANDISRSADFRGVFWLEDEDQVTR